MVHLEAGHEEGVVGIDMMSVKSLEKYILFQLPFLAVVQ
jgi:hypothetical protein